MEPTMAVNGDASSSASASTKTMTPSRQQAKSPYSKAGDNNLRKPLGAAPDDGAQKRTAPPQAWKTGMNPITQRTMTPTLANGGPPTPKSSTTKPAATESVSHEKQAAHRIVHLITSLLGLQVYLHTKSGDVFTGILAGAALEGPEPSYLLKMVRPRSREPSSGVELEYVGTGPDCAMTFAVAEVTSMLATNVPEVMTTSSQNGTASEFRTDRDIAGNGNARERHLQKWVAPTPGGADMALESTGNWDQFAANEQQFGVKSDYDESIYTTRIDRSNPLYPMRLAEADRIAREIEADSSNNAHMREERGQGEEDGADEEERYSGVRRNGPDYSLLQSSNPNRYMPPARRPGIPKNVAAGSSVDPAIISSQIAQSSPKVQERPAPATEIKANLDASSDAAKNGEQKLAPQAKPTKDIPTRPTLTIAPKPTAVATTATKNVEASVREAFHQFANEEKLKVEGSRRSRASADKAIKFNDLVKFSKNFKLNTPIPKDLVPILAKDKTKQEDLVQKAQQNAQVMASGPKSNATAAAGKALFANGTKNEAGSKTNAAAPNNQSAKVLHQQQQQQHQQQAVRSRPPVPPEQILTSTQMPLDQARAGSGLLGHRLADGHRMHKLGNQNVPAPLPIQDARKRSSGAGVMTSTPSPQRLTNLRSPTSAKMNANAAAFKPNPAANAFKPIDPSDASSPQSGRTTRPVSRPHSPSEFFGNRKPVPPAERQSILDHFNPLKYLKSEAEKEGNDYPNNGGIRPAYRTPPTWNPPREPEEFKSYKDLFAAIPPLAVPHDPSPNSQPLPHAHQLPPHLQGNPGLPQVHAPHQVPPSMPAQMHHYGQQHPHDEHYHAMRPSASNSSVYHIPSPRVQSMTMATAYPSSPMAQHAQLYSQSAQPYYMSVAANGQPVAFRPYPGGSPMLTQGAHLTPMVVPQQVNPGMMVPQPMGYPVNPQLAMYPSGHPQAYTPPHQPPNGYPSPGRGAPMMMHQGSHQGHHHPGYVPPNQYGQPVYTQQQQGHLTPLRTFGSPQPSYAQNAFGHQYPHQPHRTPSSGYAQLSQVHHQHLGSQQGPPQGPSMDTVDTTK